MSNNSAPGHARHRLASLPILLLVPVLTVPVLSASAASSSDPDLLPNAAPESGSPYADPIEIPGRVEAEAYDRGGEGIGYHDLTPANSGGALRGDGVDIKDSPSGDPGQTVGWMQAGEWLEYTVSVPAGGNFAVSARVSAPAAGGTFHLVLDGVSQPPPVAIPTTGSWNVQRTISVDPELPISAGTHVLRIVLDTNGATLGGFVGDINFLDFEQVSTPTATPAPPAQPAPTPAPTATPAPVPVPIPTPTPPLCPSSLQAAINATPAGGTLRLGSCTFGETVTVNRAMTIVGPAVIDGGGIRSTWMTVSASNVTVDGLTMRNAAAGPAQSGSLNVDGVSAFTLRNATLSGGSYADLRLWNGSGHTVTNSTIMAGRAIGILGWNVTDSLISANRVIGNNTTGASAGHEAGGVKLGLVSRVTIANNDVGSNDGVGVWCDAYCASITISDNRVHDNTHQGILFEISTGAAITGNDVWENGWRFTAWGWGGGIVVSSSGGADVSGNTVAWNADGIIVISQSRWGSPAVTGNKVRDNVVALAPQPGDGSDKMAIAWLQDWSGILFNTGSGNAGSDNRYWVSVAEPQWARFGWNGAISTLATFNSTPGESGGVYLSASDLATVLANAGVPGGAKGH